MYPEKKTIDEASGHIYGGTKITRLLSWKKKQIFYELSTFN